MIVSYICRCFNASKVPCISELFNMCDILLLQETWLYSSQFCLFTKYFNNYNNVSICGMDESVIHAGSPWTMYYFFNNSSCTDIYPIYLDDSKRACGIKRKLKHSKGFVNLFTVYMHCHVNTAMHRHDLKCIVCYLYVLSTT